MCVCVSAFVFVCVFVCVCDLACHLRTAIAVHFKICVVHFCVECPRSQTGFGLGTIIAISRRTHSTDLLLLEEGAGGVIHLILPDLLVPDDLELRHLVSRVLHPVSCVDLDGGQVRSRPFTERSASADP